MLHRACLLWSLTRGELLLTRRNVAKSSGGGPGTGAVARHTVREEDYERASRRKLKREIGLAATHVGYQFQIQRQV
jgi:isopentenyldiphosphate isomerase